MEQSLLESLINHGEDTKLDYKKTAQIKSKTDYEGRAEFIRDVLSFANAHDETTGYILIGVDEKAENEDDKIVDIAHLGLDDANIQALVHEHITAPVAFTFRHVQYHGKTIGVVEIPFSNSRFHFIAKDYKTADGKVLLPRGLCLIRRGTQKVPATGHDSQRLRDFHVKQLANTPQPNLQVYLVDFADKEESTGTKLTIPDSFIKNEYLITQDGYARTFQFPKHTVEFQFVISNEGSTQAKDLFVSIELPEDCKIYKEQKANMFLPPIQRSTYNITSAFANDNKVSVSVEYLTHNLQVYSDKMFVTFPRLGETYGLAWTAHAGNMEQFTDGILYVTVG